MPSSPPISRQNSETDESKDPLTALSAAVASLNLREKEEKLSEKEATHTAEVRRKRGEAMSEGETMSTTL